MLNRTIYRDGESTWLRNQKRVKDSSVDKELKEYGFNTLHSDDQFHRMYSISKKDFLQNLKNSEDAN